MFMRVGIVVLSLLAGACGDDTNPCKDVKPYCDGNVTVNCENWQGIEGTPYEKSIIRWDCTKEGKEYGVEKVCKTGSEEAVCVDVALTPCLQNEVGGLKCDDQGAISSCAETFEGLFKSTMRCSTTIGGERVFIGTCYLAVEDYYDGKSVMCVDFPKVPCEPKNGYPKCDAKAGIDVSCSGSMTSGYFETTSYCGGECDCLK
jgi:hypothetical protein